MTWLSVKSHFRSNLSLADHSKSPSLTLRSITLDSYFSGSDLTTCKITLRSGRACVDVDISTLYCPVSCQSTPVIYRDSRHDTQAAPNRPFISLLNNTCQAGSGSEEQGELWGFENCSGWVTAVEEFLWSCATASLAKAWQAVKRNLHMRGSYCG